MKKRKPPLVLATVLVLMLVAVGIIYALKGANDDHAMAPPPPATETGERPKVTPEAVSGLAAQTQMAQPPKGGPRKMPGAEGPSISVPKQTNYKPTPNDSSTSTQWYTDQTKK